MPSGSLPGRVTTTGIADKVTGIVDRVACAQWLEIGFPLTIFMAVSQVAVFGDVTN